jgi:hypothetical protein
MAASERLADVWHSAVWTRGGREWVAPMPKWSESLSKSRQSPIGGRTSECLRDRTRVLNPLLETVSFGGPVELLLTEAINAGRTPR